MAISIRCPADHHGPLVPPPDFAIRAPRLPAEELAPALDEACRRVIAQQEESWISVVSDGELRRRFLPGSAKLDVEASFLVGNTDLRTKVRVPRQEGAALDGGLLAKLIDLGVGYLQLDGSIYSPLLRKTERSALRAQGQDPDALLTELLERDREGLAHLRSNEQFKLAIAWHDPMNLASVPFGEDLDFAAAEALFHALPVARHCFDCGPDPTSDLSFLRLLPDQTEAVLGMIDVTGPDLVDADEIVARIDQAAEAIDTDRLSLSPRHGLKAELLGDPKAAWEFQGKLLYLLLDASSRAWGIDF